MSAVNYKINQTHPLLNSQYSCVICIRVYVHIIALWMVYLLHSHHSTWHVHNNMPLCTINHHLVTLYLKVSIYCKSDISLSLKWHDKYHEHYWQLMTVVHMYTPSNKVLASMSWVKPQSHSPIHQSVNTIRYLCVVPCHLYVTMFKFWRALCILSELYLSLALTMILLVL